MRHLPAVRPLTGICLSALLVWSCIACADQPAAAVTSTPPVEAVTRTEGAAKVSVFYLTNRRRQEGRPAADTYDGERGEAHFGRCEVVFTPIPGIDQLADSVPFYIKRESNLVSLAEQTDPQRFWDQFVKAVRRTSSGSVVLFVHGYNYGFERTCRMAAEMQRLLQDQATVLAFSWPSNGLPTDYVSDQADIEWSVPALADLVGQLGKRIGRDRVQLLAHSLGTRGVVFAMQRLASGQSERPLIGRLVLLAADFDARTFVDLLPELDSLAGDITLYASANDTPLKLSQQLSGYPRLGQAGEYLTVVEGMDTIDVSSLGRYQITGHEYFYFHPVVVADLVALLGSGTPAGQRSGLQARKRGGIRYWVFDAR